MVMMCAWSVSRSISALHSRGLGITRDHSENGRLVVTFTAAFPEPDYLPPPYYPHGGGRRQDDRGRRQACTNHPGRRGADCPSGRCPFTDGKCRLKPNLLRVDGRRLGFRPVAGFWCVRHIMPLERVIRIITLNDQPNHVCAQDARGALAQGDLVW